MTYIRRIAATFCILEMLIQFVFGTPIYEYSSTVPVVNGVTLTKTNSFYTDKNISFSVIKADLSNENINLELLKSAEGADVLETVDNLVLTNKNVVSAVNADFFSHFSGKSGFSLGIEIKDGKLLQSPINPDTMATVSSSEEGIDLSYIDFEILLTAPNGKTDKVRHLNKHTTYYGDILMYTGEFNGGISPAPGGPVVEVVVVDGIVAEIRKNMPPVEIPENGCVFAVSEWVNMFFGNNFKVGNPIGIEYKTSIDFERVQTAFGAGAMLVSEGETVEDFSHEVSGYNPRSALGVDESGKILYLVAVDGRQDSSKGMKMQELAELMKGLGCYNAVNLDGGGSTRMVSKTVLEKNIVTVNSPTENRRVINAVAVSLEKEEDYDKEVCGIYLPAHEDNILVGQSMPLKALLYDKYMQETDGDVFWFSDSGMIENSVFVADKPGKVTIAARCGGYSESFTVNVIDEISGIITQDVIYLDVNETKKLDVSVFDKRGNATDVTEYSFLEVTSSNSDVVVCDGLNVIAVGRGTAVVKLKRGIAESNVFVIVGKKTVEYNENFEVMSGRFISYPAELSLGNFELTSEYVFSGNSSGALYYDFADETGISDFLETAELLEEAENGLIEINEMHNDEYKNDEEITQVQAEENDASEVELSAVSEFEKENVPDVAKGAYYALEKRIEIDESCEEISVYVMSQSDFNHSFRAQFLDANGRIVISEFEETPEKGIWKKISAKIPDKGMAPLKLDRLYVLYSPGENRDSGFIYMDELSFITNDEYKIQKFDENMYNIYGEIPSDVFGKFTVSVLPESGVCPMSEYILQKTKEASEYDETDHTRMVIGETDGFNTYEDDNALYVTVDTSENGIRNTDKTQWAKLRSALECTGKNNVFIISGSSVFGNDDFENKVICDYLSSLDKNVFVIWKSDKNTYMNISGVNYFTVGGYENSKLTFFDEKPFTNLEFTFGLTTSFEWKKL